MIHRPRAACCVLASIAVFWPNVLWAATIDCRAYIPGAERYYDLPPGLLSAVAAVESGHYPWTINLAGKAVATPDFASAAKLLRSADGLPRRDVAVGCLQIHMRYHLQKFPAPEWALVPAYNVWYGAGLLRELKDRYGDWETAVGHYNASDPAARKLYVSQVASRLAAAPRKIDSAAEAARLRIMAARRNSSLIVAGSAP